MKNALLIIATRPKN